MLLIKVANTCLSCSFMYFVHILPFCLWKKFLCVILIRFVNNVMVRLKFNTTQNSVGIFLGLHFNYPSICRSCQNPDGKRNWLPYNWNSSWKSRKTSKLNVSNPSKQVLDGNYNQIKKSLLDLFQS